MPLIQDKNLTVIWTISHEMFGGFSPHQNNNKNDEMNQNFYLDIFDYFEYLSIGFNNSDIFDNLLLKYLDSNFILFVKEQIQSSFRGLLNRDLIFKTDVKINNSEKIDVEQYLEKYPDYFDYRIVAGQCLSNAMFYIYRKNGQLACIELEPEYLREVQSKSEIKLKEDTQNKNLQFYSEEKKEILFEKMLKLFKKNKINLIVNNYFDAPYNYTSKTKEIYLSKVEKIKKQVENYGFKFVSINSEKMENKDFFDSNHLNSKGSKKYSKLLAEEILNLEKKDKNAF